MDQSQISACITKAWKIELEHNFLCRAFSYYHHYDYHFPYDNFTLVGCNSDHDSVLDEAFIGTPKTRLAQHAQVPPAAAGSGPLNEAYRNGPLSASGWTIPQLQSVLEHLIGQFREIMDCSSMPLPYLMVTAMGRAMAKLGAAKSCMLEKANSGHGGYHVAIGAAKTTL
jgi:hypothetical protein